MMDSTLFMMSLPLFIKQPPHYIMKLKNANFYPIFSRAPLNPTHHRGHRGEPRPKLTFSVLPVLYFVFDSPLWWSFCLRHALEVEQRQRPDTLTRRKQWLYFSNQKSNKGGKALKTPKPLDLVIDQYQILMTKLKSTRDVQEKNKLFRRLANLLAVMEFLLTVNKSS
ncbi:hypothetical protein [Citrifermentans bremense]|uniref:hypothetical protein n=1 Tax=Citrifermentans bremense TaxID=60035 RepID=UPI0012EB924D|nr:hypothetical protein [Citrifermentans bremense]